VKLISATVSNYRIHKETSVDFNSGLTLISGPNESGKSTLAEAIHRALFFRAKAGGESREQMNSVWGEPPRVTLRFEVGGKAVTLAKTYRGGRGECTLNVAGEGGLSGDAAEERLAELLKSGAPVGGQGAGTLLLKRWAHLWVWQGLAGTSPTRAVAEEQDTLVQRLQGAGGAAVMQSELDARVFRGIQMRRDSLFTDNGAVRKACDLAKAEDELRAMQSLLAERQQAVQALEEAVARHSRASDTITEKTRALEAGDRERIETERKLRESEELIRARDPIIRRMQDATSGIEELEGIANELASARQARDDAAKALAPMTDRIRTLKDDLEDSRGHLRETEGEWEVARTAAATARAWRTALESQLLLLQRTRERRALEIVLGRIAATREEQLAIRAEIARTPSVDRADLVELGELSHEVIAADAAVSSLGARIEIVESREPITVGGDPLAVGGWITVTRDTDVQIGATATLRIKPGNDTSLVGARQTAADARRKIEAKLTELCVTSPAEAGDVYMKRQELLAKDAALQKELDRLDAEGNAAALDACQKACEEAALRASLAARECGNALPSDPAVVQAAAGEAADACRLAEQAERDLDAALKVARERCGNAEDAYVQANAAASDLQRRDRDALVRIETVEDRHGSDDSRATRMLELRARRDEASAELAVLQGRVDDLQPDQLRTDLSRLEGAVEQARNAIEMANVERAAAAERLRLSGTTDPRVDLETARAAVDRAARRHGELRDQAAALQYLACVAADVQRSGAERINAPLEDAVKGYLECVFGPGASAKLAGALQSGDSPELLIMREPAGLGTFNFGELSGGTREQVGIAMRLAMAEVLASDHDGCLPIVLDDSFANSDPGRVSALQRMLYRAAQRGLQIIVLTCTPSDYGTLGASEVRLSRPVLSQHMAPRPSAPEATSPAPDAEPPGKAIDGGDTAVFLEKLRERGGSSGNMGLREALGWSQEQYDGVKKTLLASGMIVLGQGRGGTVRLA